MSKDEPSVYVPMQEQMDSIKYADIQPSPYESTYQQDLYQEQGVTGDTCGLLSYIHANSFSLLYATCGAAEHVASEDKWRPAHVKDLRLKQGSHGLVFFISYGFVFFNSVHFNSFLEQVY